MPAHAAQAEATPTVHATAIAADGRAALIRGASGSGKSDLALRCIAGALSPLLPHAARLVADDRVILERRGSRLLARAPARLAGLIEVRGLGIVRLPFEEQAEVRLVVDLVAADRVPRLPDPPPEVSLDGVTLPLLRLAAFETSAALKLRLALARL